MNLDIINIIMNRLFVGGISSETTEEDIYKYFLMYGIPTSYTIVRSNRTSRY